ncbi:MAG TPA: formate dehydrogenase accessory sulfurtransferase FdhD [Methanosarcina sp.]|nr:formate dehydrogenase accessory sulfurtransferase FdhD [Methanosarcina sp.]
MPEKYTVPYPAKKIHSDGRKENTEVLLARECPIKLFLDEKILTTLFASPIELKELAVGHLITEGILNFKEIQEIEVKRNEVHVLTKEESYTSKDKEQGADVFVESSAVFEPEALFAGTEHLESDTYKLTRGTHLAALIDKKGKLSAQIVDVGRHNALDKVVGAALLRQIDLSNHYMLSTGRQPAYMVTKAARAGIPLIATKAMPFDSGVEAAKKANLCLVGQLRKEAMLIFANEWRVKTNKK